jgi:hypothetical protein
MTTMKTIKTNKKDSRKEGGRHKERERQIDRRTNRSLSDISTGCKD